MKNDKIVELLQLALRHIPEEAMEYSEGSSGDRVYVTDKLRHAIEGISKEQPFDDDTLEFETEEIVDRSSLRETLEALARVCRGKADHLLSNWQDEKASRAWEKAGGVIDKAAGRISVNL